MEREELTKRLAALRHDLRGSPMAKPEFSANIPDTLGQRLDRFAAAISSAKKTDVGQLADKILSLVGKVGEAKAGVDAVLAELQSEPQGESIRP